MEGLRNRIRVFVSRRTSALVGHAERIADEGVLLALVSLELFSALFKRIPWAELATTLDELVLLPTALSFLSYVSSEIAFLNDGLLVVIYAATFYRSISLALSAHVLPDETSADSLPLLLTSLALAVTIWVGWFTEFSSTNTRVVLTYGSLLTGTGVFLLVTYLVTTRKRHLSVFFYDTFRLQMEQRESKRSPRFLGAFSMLFTASTLTFFCFVLGVLVGVVSLFELLPELLLVVALLRWGRIFDIEGQFQEQVLVVVRSPKGIPSITLVVSGLVLSLLPFYNGVTELREGLTWVFRFRDRVPTWLADPFATDLTLHNSMRVWNGFNGAVDVFAGFFLVWFWLSVARRLSAFVTAWSDRYQDGPTRPRTSAGGDFLVRPTRPMMLLLIAILLWVSERVFRLLALQFGDTVWAGYTLLWPVFCLLGLWSFGRSQNYPPQRALTDQYAIPLAFGIQTASVVWMLRSFFLLLMFEQHLFTSLCFVGIGLYFWPDAQIAGRTDIRRLFSQFFWGVFLSISLASVAYVLLPGDPPLDIGLGVLFEWLRPMIFPPIATWVTYGAIVTSLLSFAEPITRRRFGVSVVSLILPNVATFFLLSFLGPVLNYLINIGLS